MLQHGNSKHFVLCGRTGETRPTSISWLLHISHCRTGETLPTQSLHVDASRSHVGTPMCSSQPLCIGPRAADGDGSQTGARAVRCAWVRRGRGAWVERVRVAAASPLHLFLVHLLISPCCTGLNGKRVLACQLILSCGLINVWVIQSENLDLSLWPIVHILCRQLVGFASERRLSAVHAKFTFPPKWRRLDGHRTNVSTRLTSSHCPVGYRRPPRLNTIGGAVVTCP